MEIVRREAVPGALGLGDRGDFRARQLSARQMLNSGVMEYRCQEARVR